MLILVIKLVRQNTKEKQEIKICKKWGIYPLRSENNISFQFERKFPLVGEWKLSMASNCNMLHKVGIFFQKPLIFIFKFAFYIYYTVRYCNAYSTVCFRCFNITLTNHCVKKIKCNKCDANVLNALANLCTGVNNYFCRQTRKRDAVKWIKKYECIILYIQLKMIFL